MQDGVGGRTRVCVSVCVRVCGPDRRVPWRCRAEGVSETRTGPGYPSRGTPESETQCQVFTSRVVSSTEKGRDLELTFKGLTF